MRCATRASRGRQCVGSRRGEVAISPSASGAAGSRAVSSRRSRTTERERSVGTRARERPRCHAVPAFFLTNPLQITMFPFFIRVPARRGRRGTPGPSPGERRRGTTGGQERGRSDGREREHHERAGEGQEHRHQRPHRLGQDDAHRAHPLLHQAHPRDPRGQGQGRRRREDGLDGARARARHHDPVRRDQLRLGRLHDQHHRHARARRLHDRGRALAARARRRDPRALLGRRRAVPVHHRRPPDDAATRCRASPSSTSATAPAPTPSASSRSCARSSATTPC